MAYFALKYLQSIHSAHSLCIYSHFPGISCLWLYFLICFVKHCFSYQNIPFNLLLVQFAFSCSYLMDPTFIEYQYSYLSYDYDSLNQYCFLCFVNFIYLASALPNYLLSFLLCYSRFATISYSDYLLI